MAKLTNNQVDIKEMFDKLNAANHPVKKYKSMFNTIGKYAEFVNEYDFFENLVQVEIRKNMKINK